MPIQYTPRQVEVLRYFAKHNLTYGYMPTYKQAAEALGVSQITIFEHLGALEKKGSIKRNKHHARGIQIIDAHFLAQEVPDQLRLNTAVEELNRGQDRIKQLEEQNAEHVRNQRLLWKHVVAAHIQRAWGVWAYGKFVRTVFSDLATGRELAEATAAEGAALAAQASPAPAPPTTELKP